MENENDIKLGYIHYEESRTINIGNFESVKCKLSYGTEVRPINNKEFVLSTKHSEIVRLDESKTYNEAVKLVVHRVKRVLDAREADVRLKTAKFVDDFLPEAKVLYQELVSLSNWRKKNKKHQVTLNEVKEHFKLQDQGVDIEEEDWDDEDENDEKIGKEI